MIVPVRENQRRDPWGFRQQRWSSPTERSTSTTMNGDCTSRLHSVWLVSLDGGHRDVNRHRNTSVVVGVVWRQKSTKLWALSRLQSHIRTLAKLSLETFW